MSLIRILSIKASQNKVLMTNSLHVIKILVKVSVKKYQKLLTKFVGSKVLLVFARIIENI